MTVAGGVTVKDTVFVDVSELVEVAVPVFVDVAAWLALCVKDSEGDDD